MTGWKRDTPWSTRSTRTASARPRRNGTARADIDPDLKAIEVIAFLNGLETSWLLNPSLPVEDVAAAWRDSQVAQMTTGPYEHEPDRAAAPE